MDLAHLQVVNELSQPRQRRVFSPTVLIMMTNTVGAATKCPQSQNIIQRAEGLGTLAFVDDLMICADNGQNLQQNIELRKGELNKNVNEYKKKTKSIVI